MGHLQMPVQQAGGLGACGIEHEGCELHMTTDGVRQERWENGLNILSAFSFRVKFGLKLRLLYPILDLNLIYVRTEKYCSSLN